MTRRAPPHTQQEWNLIKPEFIKLYVQNGKKLQQVVKTLEARGFLASVKQYKSKIKEWKLGKYFKERELLHAVRKLNNAKSRGKIVKIKIRQQPVTIDDVMKHFGRKSVLDEDDLRSRLPASPTPSAISSRSVAETEIQDQTPQPTTSTMEQNSLDLAIPTNGIGAIDFERGLLAMSALAHGSVNFLRADATDLQGWRTPSHIVKHLNRTQYHLNVGRISQACINYNNALDSAMQSATLSCASILQLILQLFAWSLYGNTTILSKAFLRYLAEVKSPMIHPTLLVVARTLRGSYAAEAWSRMIYQQIVCDVFEDQFGSQSPMLFWARIRLYRQLFFSGMLEAASSIWKLIEDTRSTTANLLTPSLRYEIDREIGATLHRLGNSRAAKHYLEGVFNYYLSQPGRRRDRLAYTLQQLAACNAQLKLYAIAHAQAKEAANIFASLYGEHDNLVVLSLHLANRIEISSIWTDASILNEPHIEPECIIGLVCTTPGGPTEPECSGYDESGFRYQQNFFILCDAGGGTVDITSYRTTSSRFEHGLFPQAETSAMHESEFIVSPFDSLDINHGDFDIYPEEQVLSLAPGPGAHTYRTLKSLSALLTID